ncbi:hypothetical protein SEPL_216 [Salmonella phage SE_PL]|uniref:DUF2828 family protein n=1 Tax=Salmonella enterica TaxID=28901 RepID=UPI000FDF7EAA|nr:hypothetical protein CPT_Munch_210 [Salmonella phage Munch]EAZ2022997.1 DUF2828 family protein [Salmonella enterica]MCP0435766.1 DUF2828 family protein [Salmonella enterica subsp. enterica serovar Mbandaka]QCW18897.1 structural protein [Salmonella phage 7t3]QIG62829.1 hypothetical protein SEPL_216 [Salmonella phage SE_PL]
MSFKQAVNNMNVKAEDNVSSTANGAVSLASSLNPLVDLFAILGSVRGKDFSTFENLFEQAYSINRKLTLQMVLWLRDVRGGAGERETTRQILRHLEAKHPQDLIDIIPVLAEYGRWDDLLIFTMPTLKEIAYKTIAENLKAGNGLCAKWMPRVYKLKKSKDGSVNKESVANVNRIANNQIARELMQVMGLNERQYRKLLSSTSNTVEQNMCAKDWSNIEYSHVPSVAMNRYRNAFMRNDEERFTTFGQKVASGEVSVNASALFPYDITTKIRGELDPVLVGQWDSLPDYLNGSKILPMCDTSGSMGVSAGGGKMSCLDVAKSLSLYTADKQKGAFKDVFLTFSEEPDLFVLEGNNIHEKYHDLCHYENYEYWGGSTDIGKAFDKVLEVAVKQNVPQEDMPEYLIIYSDMEFNETYCDGNNGNWSVTAHEYAKAKFAAAGYELPHVIFWNLNGRVGNNPVRFDETGTAMVSGFSPAVLKAILSGEQVDPVSIMLAAIDVPRYKVIA